MSFLAWDARVWGVAVNRSQVASAKMSGGYTETLALESRVNIQRIVTDRPHPTAPITSSTPPSAILSRSSWYLSSTPSVR